MTIIELINQKFVRSVSKDINYTDPTLVPTSYGLCAIPWIWGFPYPGLIYTGSSVTVCSLLADIPTSVRDTVPQSLIVDGAYVDTIYYQGTQSFYSKFSSAVIVCFRQDEVFQSAMYVAAFESILIRPEAVILVLAADPLSGFLLKSETSPPTASEIEPDKVTIIGPGTLEASDFNMLIGIEFIPVSLVVTRPQSPYGNAVPIAQNQLTTDVAIANLTAFPYILPTLVNAAAIDMAKSIPSAVCRWTGSYYVFHPLVLDTLASRWRYFQSVSFQTGRFPIFDPSVNNFLVENRPMVSMLGSLYQLVPAEYETGGMPTTKRGQALMSEETSAYFLLGGHVRSVNNVITYQTETPLQFNERVHNVAGLSETLVPFFDPLIP